VYLSLLIHHLAFLNKLHYILLWTKTINSPEEKRTSKNGMAGKAKTDAEMPRSKILNLGALF